MKILKSALAVVGVYLLIGVVINAGQLLWTRLFEPDCRGTVQHSLWEDFRTRDASQVLIDRVSGKPPASESPDPFVLRVARSAARWLPNFYNYVITGDMTIGNYLLAGYQCEESQGKPSDVLIAFGTSVYTSVAEGMAKAAGSLAEPKPGSRAADLLRDTTAPPDVPMATWTSKEGRFSIAMPGQASYSSKELSTKMGQITLYTWTSEMPGELAFSIMYNDYSNTMEDVDGFFERVLRGASEGRQLTRATRIQVDGRPAQRAELVTPTLRFVQIAVLEGTRLYQMIFAGPLDAPVPPQAEQFLQSLKILNQP